MKRFSLLAVIVFAMTFVARGGRCESTSVITTARTLGYLARYYHPSAAGPYRGGYPIIVPAAKPPSSQKSQHKQ